MLGWPDMGGQHGLKLVLELATFTGGDRWQVFPNTADGLKAVAQSSYKWDRWLVRHQLCVAACFIALWNVVCGQFTMVFILALAVNFAVNLL